MSGITDKQIKNIIMPLCASKMWILCRILVTQSQKVLTRTGKALEKGSKDGESCTSVPMEARTKETRFCE